MTTELTKAAQQALEALKNVTDYDQINAARRALQSALTTSQPAQAGEVDDQEQVYSDQLTKAKRLLVDLHKIGGERVQAMIEARTGSWFVWGQDRASLPTQPAAQDTPEPVRLDVVRQAIEERDAMESSYHALAQSMVYEGNSVSWWHSKAKAYRNAIDDVWSALKAAGICADGTKTCADGVRELAATPTQQAAGEPVAWRYKIPTHGGGTAWTHMRPQPECLIEAQPLYTHPAPGVPDFATILKVKEPDGCATDIEQANRQEARCDGWNDCREEVLRLLAAAQAKGGEA